MLTLDIVATAKPPPIGDLSSGVLHRRLCRTSSFPSTLPQVFDHVLALEL